MDYKIEGDNLEVVRIRLQLGDEVVAEAGKMVYKTPQVEWRTSMHGEGIGQKLIGALRRKVTGESLFLTHFSCRSRPARWGSQATSRVGCERWN